MKVAVVTVCGGRRGSIWDVFIGVAREDAWTKVMCAPRSVGQGEMVLLLLLFLLLLLLLFLLLLLLVVVVGHILILIFSKVWFAG
jgi:hypothetical protein